MISQLEYLTIYTNEYILTHEDISLSSIKTISVDKAKEEWKASRALIDDAKRQPPGECGLAFYREGIKNMRFEF